MKKSTDIALSILAGTTMGTAGGILLAIAIMPIVNKVIDRYEDEAYQKVWNAGVDLVEAVIEVIEEEMDNV